MCVFQKTVVTMESVALGGKCGEKANGYELATGNAREESCGYDFCRN